jgi:hypothetical protein
MNAALVADHHDRERIRRVDRHRAQVPPCIFEVREVEAGMLSSSVARWSRLCVAEGGPNYTSVIRRTSGAGGQGRMESGAAVGSVTIDQ